MTSITSNAMARFASDVILGMASRIDPRPIAFRSLSPARQMIIRIGEEMPFGRVYDLAVRDGQPRWVPMPRFVPTVGESHHRHHARASDQTLIKSRFLCFFEVLNLHRDFVIAELIYQDGLPIDWKLEAMIAV